MEKQNKKQQEEVQVVDSLTLLQEIALQGEVCMCYETAMHQYDKVYNTYILLASVIDTKYLPFYREEMLNYVDEEVIDKCYKYIVQGIFPVSIFAQKFVADLKSYLGCAECSVKDKMPKVPKQILKSKYVGFIRMLSEVLPSISRELIAEVTRDDTEKLSFLNDVSFSLLMEIAGKPDVIKDDIIQTIKVLQTPLLECMPLSFIRETRELEGSKKEEDITAFINSVIEKAKGESVSNTVYQVNKIDKSSKAVVFTKEFSSQAKAVEYIKNIGKDYPDILQRYDFKVVIVEN